MIIGLLTVKLQIPMSNSLKTKRRAIKSLKERLRKGFNVSVAEIDYHDKWQMALIAVAAVSTDSANVNSTMSKAIDLIDRHHDVVLLDQRIELL